ncbi:rodlin [Streptomyces sp. SL13]|uniref:Rodlin n=1 Tax=Streptantibioticus silvisoli TaxID=2705255 RepID=A0AA90KFR8_9ACTN|nr:rodlin [Streptantibioticus silvisoli]MDI5962608.1 rodlin [Streptantibioticus silvisoli]MDI5969239.1 rodlin [Streptantibioticus silvisoli]
MIKKILATAAVVAAAAGVTAAPAMAVDNDHGPSSSNGTGAQQAYGNTTTGGLMSPQVGLVQGSANKLCVGLPLKADATSLVGVLVPVGVQDILTQPQIQQCAENSSQVKGDDPLSHIADHIPVLSANGANS